MAGTPSDSGAVTVEAAIAVCTVVVVLVAAIGAILATAAHLRCMDAAREAARLVARGEPERANAIAAELAPQDAEIVVAVRGDEARVEVSVGLLGGRAANAMPQLSAAAVAILEPGVADPSRANGLAPPATDDRPPPPMPAVSGPATPGAAP